MTLADDIFPKGSPRDGLIARTEYVGSWKSQFRGLGRHTAFLSKYLLKFSAAVDDIAIDVVFLQRHRVEVGLKLILERASATIPRSHDIADLAERCKRSLDALGRSDLAAQFATETTEFVQLMHESDPGSFAYRYPVDTKQEPATRHPYVDLKELEVGGSRFQASILTIIDALTADEPVPIADEEVDSTASEAEALLRAIRSNRAFWTQTYSEIVGNRDKLVTLTGRRIEDDQAPTQKAAADEYMELFTALEPQLLLLLRRLEPRRQTAAVPADIEPGPITPLPQITIGTPQVVNTQLHSLMRAFVDGLAPRMFELKRTLMLLRNRTESWQSPADLQLHADLGRFASRLMSGVDPLAQSATTAESVPHKSEPSNHIE
jgi:hypothetical protein